MALGSTFAELYNADKTLLLELGIDVGVVSCDWENYLYTKYITISPRFILINKMKHKIALKTES